MNKLVVTHWQMSSHCHCHTNIGVMWARYTQWSMVEGVDERKCFTWTRAGSYGQRFSASRKAKDSTFLYSDNLKKKHGKSVECIQWNLDYLNPFGYGHLDTCLNNWNYPDNENQCSTTERLHVTSQSIKSTFVWQNTSKNSTIRRRTM